MVLFRNLLPAIFLVPLVCFSFIAAAQDMDSVEGVYRQQYEQYTAQETTLQQQMDALASVKSQVDDLISQVSGAPTTNYNQEAARYQQLQLLLPSAIQYSRDLAALDKQLTEIRKHKAELRDRVLARQSALPVWWTQ
jgi:predicted  nucleic acid-binding Zn-ribbon protein